VSNVQDPASGTTCSYPPPLHPPPSWHLGSPGYRRQPSRSRAKLMRRFCLTVDHDDNADAGSCRLTQERLERVCDALERVRRIEYLRLDVKCSGVHIDKCTWEKKESDYQNVPFTERQRRGFGGRQEMVAILQTWLGGCFRKIKTVEIVGLSEQCASTLKGSLMGKDPLDLEIPNMCDIMGRNPRGAGSLHMALGAVTSRRSAAEHDRVDEAQRPDDQRDESPLRRHVS